MNAVAGPDAHAIELIALSKRYARGAPPAVDGIDLKIPVSSYCCLLGPSGCGKTSTLRMIAGHESPPAAHVLLGGREITHLSPAARGTAMMFQSYALFPHLTVLGQRGIQRADEGRRARRARRQGAELLEAGRDGALCPASAGSAVGRPAAARGAGPCADDATARAAARRAAVGARPVPAHQDARRAAALAARARHDVRARHALAGRSDGAGRPGGGDEPRPHRTGRLAARGVRAAAHRVRRPLHRCATT